MMDNAPHIPVMLNEMVEYMAPEAGKRYVDGTFGAGGYTRALLKQAECEVVALDRDPTVVPYAAKLEAEYPSRFRFIAGPFGSMDSLLEHHHLAPVHGIVLDIGMSSMQVDTPERGFSFQHDAPLDMRMGQSGEDAASLLNRASESEIADILFAYGGERKSRQIARRIVAERQNQPITRTLQLANLVRSVLRGKPGAIDPATRTFQALRIWVNDELGELQRALVAAERVLAPGGRLVVVSFHSLEDSIVKRFFRERNGQEENVSRYLPPVASKPKVATWKEITRRAIGPTEEEIQKNPRARSAKLRAAWKCGDSKEAA